MNPRLKASLMALLASWVCSSDALAAPNDAGRTHYMERCGGCHGLDGRSVGRLVPDLKDRAGYFLCTPAGREYFGRLPNIAFSTLSDSDLADVMNYVAFSLGAASAPPDARRYQPEDVARLRKRPLTSTDLLSERRSVVRALVARCGAPKALAEDYAPRQ